MRQADSTIKGYLYQFNKSILEILNAKDDSEVVLEGVIEDIDIQSPDSITPIQCKYHSDKVYQISSVAPPILEMFCHYCECSVIGKSVTYILFAYFSENVDKIDRDAFIKFLCSTKDKEIIANYFHRIYTIPDSKILALANKVRKSKEEKDELLSYYRANRKVLNFRTNINDFWGCFKYIKAEQFDDLTSQIINEFEQIVDADTAKELYYPNAFSLVASLSSKKTPEERTITFSMLIAFLSQQKTVLLNRWTLAALDRAKILRLKKASLETAFALNSEVRAFAFSDDFLRDNVSTMIPFIYEYLAKYFKKPKLQKQPIFIFGNNSSSIMQNVLLALYKYQYPVNTGLIGAEFVVDSFISNRNCSPDFACKITSLLNISTEILEACQVNQLYVIGKIDRNFQSLNFTSENLDIQNINTLKYLLGLSKVLEES